MTRDEARALIAEALHDDEHGTGDWGDATAVPPLGGAADVERVASAFARADVVLDALFAGGEVERRYANWWKDRPQTRRVVLVSGEWEDENDG